MTVPTNVGKRITPRTSPKPAVAAEVSIERDTLLRMMRDSRILSLLQPLRTLAQKSRNKKKGCGCGAKTKPNLAQADFEAAKRQIANLLASNAGLQGQLKTFLQAKALRVKYLKADNSGFIVRKFA